MEPTIHLSCSCTGSPLLWCIELVLNNGMRARKSWHREPTYTFFNNRLLRKDLYYKLLNNYIIYDCDDIKLLLRVSNEELGWNSFSHIELILNNGTRANRIYTPRLTGPRPVVRELASLGVEISGLPDHYLILNLL